MLVHTHKVMPILSSVLIIIGISDLVGRDQPRGHPSVDPSTLGGKTLYELASLKYCYITYAESIKDCFQTNTVIRYEHMRVRHPHTQRPHDIFLLTDALYSVLQISRVRV